MKNWSGFCKSRSSDCRDQKKSYFLKNTFCIILECCLNNSSRLNGAPENVDEKLYHYIHIHTAYTHTYFSNKVLYFIRYLKRKEMQKISMTILGRFLKHTLREDNNCFFRSLVYIDQQEQKYFISIYFHLKTCSIYIRK